MTQYNHKKIESKWQEIWDKTGIYKTEEDSKKPKFYALDMFPYPSGAGLHVGHPKGYIATDSVTRYKKMQGFRVLHPMGWDAFGLPTENFAIKNKVHPRTATEKNIKTFKSQLKVLGFNYDWEREIDTTDPLYYKWTQWIFLKLFEKGLAYESFEPIIWCPSCKTGLALEDLEGGTRCERCGTEVERKPLRQWVLRMTEYADRLLYDLDKEDLNWPDSVKEQQKSWIGRSEGTEIKFKMKNEKLKSAEEVIPTKEGFEDSSSLGMTEPDVITVFTTRVDTIFGCTYVVLAPEHPLVALLLKENKELRIENKEEIEKYVKNALKKSDFERSEMLKEKTGVKLEGICAINPFNNEEVPVFVADYVIGRYGTGAVMAVPAHDERDFEFAKKYDLKIIETVISKIENQKSKTQKLEKAFTDYGVLVNSGDFNGLSSEEAKKKMADWLEETKNGRRKINYKMHDWVFSRQRYWGEPIPLIHCAKCGVVPVPEKELPVELPDIKNYEPTGTGESPLAAIEEWVNVKCPKCDGNAKRETNTMPQWAGSCWYYLSFIDPKNDQSLVSKEKENEWMPVDLYVGGAEHATRHLLYARFWHKFLYDIGAVSTLEPFKKLVNVGLILAEDGRKMSKRWGNVVNPDEVVNEYGADSMRLYEMFMGPFTQEVTWSTSGVKGVRRFLERYFSLAEEVVTCTKRAENPEEIIYSSKEIEETAIQRTLARTIKKVGEDIEDFKFNTGVSALMEALNELYQIKSKVTPNDTPTIWREALEQFSIILSPFCPHITEEVWEMLGYEETIYNSSWPKFNEDLLQDDVVTIAIQINGKVRGEVVVSIDTLQEQIEQEAKDNENIAKYLEGEEIKKVIYIKGKLLSIVI